MTLLLILMHLIVLGPAPAPRATDAPPQIKAKFRPEPLAPARGGDR